MTSRLRTALALAGALLTCALALPAGAAARPAQLTVMTFNIASAVVTDNDLTPIAAAIRRDHPGVVGLQEVDRSWSRSDSVDQPVELAGLLGMHWSFDANIDCTAEDFDADGFCQYGTAILSRYALRASVTRQYRLPRPPGDEQRGLAQVGITVGGHRLTVFNTHLSTRVTARRDQVRYVLNVLRTVHGPFILMGDFNARPRAEEVRWLDARLTDAAIVGRVTRPTVGTTRIDYILASSGVTVLSATVPLGTQRMVSDHRPLIARLAIGR